ncbi:MAG: alpha/beta hydrolase [Alphaproteobacteria bacterium]|nr:alpha/beta hydrolase [Alphaproteobacteria bacterium]MDE2041698.1 alpha/beta hydrolase [Alphaproteobacteria bacterium]MDE2341365.1 alpha/beta hydrolase [Alphaproteobacteria bacterium]
MTEPMTPFVRPDVRFFLDNLSSLGMPALSTVPLELLRAQSGSLTQFDIPAGPMAVKRDFAIPGPTGAIRARHYDKREGRSGAGLVLVYYHGGGFVVGDIASHDSFVADIAQTLDIPVVSVEYRLAPEHPWPAAPDDAEAAARWVAAHMNCTGLVIAGDSAGGNLAVVTTMALRNMAAARPVVAQWAIYPVVAARADAFASGREFAEGYFLSTDDMIFFEKSYAADPASWRYAPLGHDMTGMPPALVSTASLDPLCDQGRAYVKALEQAGVLVMHREAKGNIHGYATFRKAIPSSIQDVTGDLVALKSLLDTLK